MKAYQKLILVQEAEKPGENTTNFVVRILTLDTIPGLDSYKLKTILNEVIRSDNISGAAFEPANTLVCMVQYRCSTISMQLGDTVSMLRCTGRRVQPPKRTTKALRQTEPGEAVSCLRSTPSSTKKCFPSATRMPYTVYRIPRLVATSFDRDKAIEFMRKAPEPRVRYEVRLKDPNTLPSEGGGGCMQVNYLEKSKLNSEREFLFSAFSTFRVLAVDDSQITNTNPYEAMSKSPSRQQWITNCVGRIPRPRLGTNAQE